MKILHFVLYCRFLYVCLSVFLQFFLVLKISYASSLNNFVENSKVGEEVSTYNELSLKKRKSTLDSLIKAKTFLINGNLRKAKRLYLKNIESSLYAKKIAYYHLSIIYFIEDNFEQSLQALGQSVLQSDSDYRKYCSLKIINLIALKRTELLRSELNRCTVLNFGKSPSQHFWLEGMVYLALKDMTFFSKKSLLAQFNNINQMDLNFLRVLLKLIVFLNKEELVKDLLYHLPQEAYESHILREIIGFIFYRLGDEAKALSFLDDLTSPNAENIKGNINLAKKKDELAFGHFQLAINKKANSSNAIKRSVPLAWKLKQWDKGVELVKKTKTSATNQKLRLPLLIAFLLQAGKYKEAHKTLLELDKLVSGRLSKMANTLFSYNSIKLNQLKNLKYYSEKACYQLDGLNCWILLQSELWEDLIKTIQRSDAVHEEKELTLENLKQKTELDPLDEPIFIHQQDIEEMDHKSFELKI